MSSGTPHAIVSSGSAPDAAALAGLTVLDLSASFAGAWCARLLADFGATVLMRDPHPLRKVGPFDDAGLSIPARAALVNRRAVALAPDDARWLALAAAADVVVDSAGPGTPDRAWIDRLVAGCEAIHVVITPHGLTGVRATRPGNDLTAGARSGWASVNGLAGAPPLKPSGYQASYQAGTLAFAAAVSALIHRQQGGPAQRIDVAVDDVSAVTFAPGILRALYDGKPIKRKAAVDVTTGPVPVRDGYFALTITRPHFWRGASRLLGLGDLADDPRLQVTASRNAHAHLFVDRLQTAMLQWTKADLFARLSEIPVVAGPVFTMAELDTCEQLAARGYFTEVDGVRHPGAPFLMSRTPFRLKSGVPRAATDVDDVLAAAARRAKPAAASSPAARGGDGPLAGFRGVVLTQAWAGTLCTQLFGLLGAEVIQVEARSRNEGWRGGDYVLPLAPAVKERPTAAHSWNCDCRFNSVNLNKQSVTLDLDKEEGRDLFARLAAKADFVVENFSPRVMAKLGLDYEALRRIKQDLIYCSISGFGHSGPWSPLPAIGGTIEPACGMSALLGYEGGAPLNSGQMYPDPVAGLYAFGAIALALFHRGRTGEGQRIDLSMQEANLTFLSERWLEYALTGRVPGPLGNRHPVFAPHGIYPAAGTDRWIALAAESEAEWQALCALAGRDDWRRRFPDNAARKAAENVLDGEIAAWTATQDRDVLAETLGAGGVIAAPVLDGLEVAAEPGFRARGTVVEVDHPEVGRWPQSAIPCVFSRTPARVRSAAPLKGAHSAAVLERLLGIDGAGYRRLEAAEVTGVAPPRHGPADNAENKTKAG